MTSRASILLDSSQAGSLQDALRALLDGVAGMGHPVTDHAVHAARKELKRARAALRLMRAAIGDAAYLDANKKLRDAARTLTPVRDATVLLRKLAEMTKPRDGKSFKTFANQLRLTLQATREIRHERLTQQVLRRNLSKLRNVNRTMKSSSRSLSDTLSARRGLKKSYRSGREAFAAARRRPDVPLLHEWRKQTKYLANELELAQRYLQLGLKNTRRRAERLASVLGDDHDLALLREEIRGAEIPAVGERQRRRLEHRIKGKRRRLQAQAHRLGKNLYREPARRFEAALRHCLR